jgi:threonine dehydratase
MTSDLIAEAATFLSGKIRQTPIEYSPELTDRLGVPVWLKLECLQLTGSFKIRGAWFRLSRWRDPILTCSAGNHGKAVAYAAREMGVPAVICVPKSVDAAKYEGMLALGAEVRVSPFPGYDDTEEWAREIAVRENKPFLSPFDDDAIMAGNGGTLALETLQQLPAAATFVVPVGGGSLSAGFSFIAKPRGIMIGCQHEQSPGLARSLAEGRAITRLPAIDTVAGGVEGGIGRLTFEVLRTRVDRVALLSEAEICEGVRWMLDKRQYLIEPSAAVTIAACLTGKVGPAPGPVVVVVSGRNVSTAVIRRILC